MTVPLVASVFAPVLVFFTYHSGSMTRISHCRYNGVWVYDNMFAFETIWVCIPSKNHKCNCSSINMV